MITELLTQLIDYAEQSDQSTVDDNASVLRVIWRNCQDENVVDLIKRQMRLILDVIAMNTTKIAFAGNLQHHMNWNVV